MVARQGPVAEPPDADPHVRMYGGVPMGRYRPANSNENGLEPIV